VPTAPPAELAGEDLLSVTEAADLTSVPRSTMARWVREGRFPRATVLQLGQIRAAWYIPITDLIAAGLVTRRRARDVPVTRAGRVVVAELERRIAGLTRDLDRARADVERLTLLTREQQAIIVDLRRRRPSPRSRS
jgi:excisionase family DNA binding protein